MWSFGVENVGIGIVGLSPVSCVCVYVCTFDEEKQMRDCPLFVQILGI